MTAQEAIDKINSSEDNVEIVNIYKGFASQGDIDGIRKVYQTCQNKIISAVTSREWLALNRNPRANFVTQIKLPGES